jgi:hypothetical protein
MFTFLLEEGYRRALCEDLQAIVDISLEKSGDAVNVSVTILEYIICSSSSCQSWPQNGICSLHLVAMDADRSRAP